MIEDKIIASDFDGVIADSAAIEEVWRDEYIDKVLPKFEVLELLEDGTIDIILTGRRDVSWVRRWLDKWVKSWHGRIICALSPGDKKRFLEQYDVDVMITDRDVWYDELVEWRDETGKLLVVVNEEVRT